MTIELAQPSEQPGKEEDYFDSSEVLKYLNPKCSGMDDKSSDDDDNGSDLSPFEKMAKSMEKLTDDGGVLKKVGSRISLGNAQVVALG